MTHLTPTPDSEVPETKERYTAQLEFELWVPPDAVEHRDFEGVVNGFDLPGGARVSFWPTAELQCNDDLYQTLSFEALSELGFHVEYGARELTLRGPAGEGTLKPPAAASNTPATQNVSNAGGSLRSITSLEQIRAEHARNSVYFAAGEMERHAQQIGGRLEGQLDRQTIAALLRIIEGRDKMIKSYHQEMGQLLGYLPAQPGDAQVQLKPGEVLISGQLEVGFESRVSPITQQQTALPAPLTVEAGISKQNAWLRVEHPANEGGFTDLHFEWRNGTLEIRASDADARTLFEHFPLEERGVPRDPPQST